MIREFELSIPADLVSEVVGYLYEADDPRELGQDMIEIQLPNDWTINAGWYPEGDQDGDYRVVTRDEGTFVKSATEYKTAAEAANEIRRIFLAESDPTNKLPQAPNWAK